MPAGQTKRLNEQQREFTRNVAMGKPLKTSAEEAGYRNPDVSANSLMNNPLVQEYLAELRAPKDAAFIASKEDCERKLTEQITDMLSPPKVVQDAINLLGKMRGWHITKTEVSGSVTLAQPELSDGEVKSRLAELFKKHPELAGK